MQFSKQHIEASVRHTASAKNKQKQIKIMRITETYKVEGSLDKMLTMHIVQYIPHLFEHLKPKHEASVSFVLLFISE